MRAQYPATLAHGAICAALVAAVAVGIAFDFTGEAHAQMRLFGLGDTREHARPLPARVINTRPRERVKPSAAGGSHSLSDLPDADARDIREAMPKDLPPRPKGSDARICATQTENLAF